MNVSRKLAFLLRHSQNPLYISLDGGWASVSVITKALNISCAQLDEIVANDEKGRYRYDIYYISLYSKSTTRKLNLISLILDFH